MTTTLFPLKWRTAINGKKKIATTHFGIQYTLTKLGDDANTWAAYLTVPRVGTEVLANDLVFAQARKVATDDYATNGGR